MRDHYENMPMPNPCTWWVYQLPEPVHSVMQYTGVNLMELVAPFLLLVSSWQLDQEGEAHDQGCTTMAGVAIIFSAMIMVVATATTTAIL